MTEYKTWNANPQWVEAVESSALAHDIELNAIKRHEEKNRETFLATTNPEH